MQLSRNRRECRRSKPIRAAFPRFYRMIVNRREAPQPLAKEPELMEQRRSSFEYEDLLACGRGELFVEGPQLPLPPMLMFDRLSQIAEAGREDGKGPVGGALTG